MKQDVRFFRLYEFVARTHLGYPTQSQREQVFSTIQILFY